jgi:adenine phosphoribosyltransferase
MPKFAVNQKNPVQNPLQQSVLDALLQVENFPREGVLFQDLREVWRNPGLCRSIVEAMAQQIRDAGGTDLILGIESRGFLLGMPLALALEVPFVPARKKGKLPGLIVEEAYALEYGLDAMEMQVEGLQKELRVFVHDDVLATGGTAEAAARMVRRAGLRLAGFSFLLEIQGLGGRERLEKSAPVLEAICRV